jgi:hypothetical protein
VAARRAPRFVLEVLFLAALAAALTFANLRPLTIAGLMLIGWVLVAVFEWGALRSRSHYGSGLPPRWYVPQFALPPPRPLEQVASGYPAPETAGDEATWIACPAMLADWPVIESDTPVEEQTQVHDVLEAELARAVSEVAREEVVEPERSAAKPLPDEVDLETPAPDEPEPVRMARHRIDPLEDATPHRRRFGRRHADEGIYADVPARPVGARSLPGRSRGDD